MRNLQNLFQRRTLFLLASLLLAARSAKGDGLVRSDFTFQVSDAIFAAPEFDFLSMLTGSQRFTLPDTSAMSDDVPVQLSGIKASVDYRFETPAKTVVVGAEFPIVSRELSAKLEITRLAVDALVSRQVGAVRVNVHVRGSCEKIPLALKGGASVQGAFRTGVDASGLPVIQIPWADARWSNDSWSIGPFECSVGGASFRDQVRAGILNYLARPSTQEDVGGRLRAVVGERLALYQEKVRQWFVQPRKLATGLKGLTVVLNPRKISAVRGESFQISGFVDFLFANPVTKATSLVVATPAPRFDDRAAYELIVPRGLPGALSEMAFRMGAYSFRKPSRDIPAFLKLLDDGLSKMVVWPQLSYYSSASPFYFEFSAVGRPEVGTLSDSGDGTLTGAASCSLETLLWAPRVEAPAGDQDFIKMLRFGAKIKGGYRLSLERRAGGADLAMAFDPIDMTLSAQWEEDYRPYLRSPSIAVETLRDKIAGALRSDGFRIFVPGIEMTSILTLTARGLHLDGEWLIFDLR